MSKLKKMEKRIIFKESKANKFFFISPKILIIIGLLLLIIFLSMFYFSSPQICKENEKPIIRMYSTNTCPHCIWIGPTFESVVKDYIDKNKIVAHHWEWIINNQGELVGVDDTLTPEFEGLMPKEEEEIFKKFSPSSSVPAFVFGCRDFRIGNKFESENDIESEKKEFIRLIENLLN
jgi:thiol-disulfide isomerase/thioredoxin